MRRVMMAAVLLGTFPALVLASKRPRLDNPPNILLVTIDTLRADHLSCYGYHLRTSPNIDRLASQGVLFQNAYCPVPLTGPSHISLMTSLFPQQHGATINGMHMTSDPHPITLAQILHRLGYRTAALVSAWPLKKGITGLGRGFGLYNQKFQYHYKLVNAARAASDVGPLSRRWLQSWKGKHPFFLWVHYFDPHQPYELHPQFAHLPSVPGADHGKIVKSSLDRETAERIRAYDSEIAFADDDLGKTLQLLDEMRVRGNTLIYVVADHGEALGEHGYFGHGDHIYQPIVHVPMIASYPKLLPQGKTVAQDVSLVDVMPTILDYIGIRLRLPIEGETLRPLIEGNSRAPRAQPVYFLTYTEPPLLPPKWLSWIWSWAKTKMTPSRLGFVKGNVKVVSEEDGDALEVYQLEDQFKIEQPVDEKTVASAALQDYRKELTAWFKRTNTGLPGRSHMGKEDVDMLRSLGYVNP